jgi:uncharacterized protein with HEPN domain
LTLPTRSWTSRRSDAMRGTRTGSGNWRRKRLLEIIGESANTLTDEFRAQHPEVPWRDIIGLRIVLAHHYHRVDPNQVWIIATREVPRLATQLRSVGHD